MEDIEMTEQNQTAFSNQEQGNATRPDAEKQPLQAPVPMVPLDEVANIVATQVAATLDKWNREQQGLRKKSEDRVKREVSAQLQSLQDAGLQVTNEQAKQIERTARQRIEDELGNDDQPKPQPAQAAPTLDINGEIESLNREYGTYLDEKDPEAQAAKKIMAEGGSPVKFLREYEKGLEAKRKRIGTPPEARIPSLATSNSPGLGLEAEYQHKLSKIRRGDISSIDNLQKEYRRRGMKI
jgi:hypothetical protein